MARNVIGETLRSLGNWTNESGGVQKRRRTGNSTEKNRVTNLAIRRYLRSELAPRGPLKNLKTAPYNAPYLYRGVQLWRLPSEVRQRMIKDLRQSKICDRGYMAFSRSRGFVKNFADPNVLFYLNASTLPSNTPYVWFHGSNKNYTKGRQVRSKNPINREVLLPPGCLHTDAEDAERLIELLSTNRRHDFLRAQPVVTYTPDPAFTSRRSISLAAFKPAPKGSNNTRVRRRKQLRPSRR